METENQTEKKLLTLKEAAGTMRKSYSWLSRTWKELGLRPSRIGRTLLFLPEDVAAAIQRNQVQTPGRPGRPRKSGLL